MTELFRLTTLSDAALRTEVERVLSLVRAVIPPGAEVLEVGSTAVPGVIGKGDIDLLARASHEHFDALRGALDAHFERNAGQLSNATYQGYLVPSSFDVAIQCTVRSGPYDDFEAFLHALREDPSEVSAYNELKRAWDGQSMAAYRVAKATFIERVLRKGAQSKP